MARSDHGDRVAVGLDSLDEQLDATAALLVAMQPRLDDPGVIHDQQIARQQTLSQITEIKVGQPQGSTRLDMQQPRCTALDRRMLGDQLVWQQIFKVCAGERGGG